MVLKNTSVWICYDVETIGDEDVGWEAVDYTRRSNHDLDGFNQKNKQFLDIADNLSVLKLQVEHEDQDTINIVRADDGQPLFQFRRG